jgi:hypothetical protein
VAAIVILIITHTGDAVLHISECLAGDEAHIDAN